MTAAIAPAPTSDRSPRPPRRRQERAPRSRSHRPSHRAPTGHRDGAGIHVLTIRTFDRDAVDDDRHHGGEDLVAPSRAGRCGRLHQVGAVVVPGVLAASRRGDLGPVRLGVGRHTVGDRAAAVPGAVDVRGRPSAGSRTPLRRRRSAGTARSRSPSTSTSTPGSTRSRTNESPPTIDTAIDGVGGSTATTSER